METSGEKAVEEPVGQIIKDKIYVAVGKDVRKCKSILLWALQNSRGKRLCIIHVHVPEQTIPFMGTRLAVSSVDERKVKEHWETKRQEMHTTLDEYIRICQGKGVGAEKVYIESDCIEKGILQLISQHGIRELVMGAAADKRYSKKMIAIKSKKAISVRLKAPTACHIWFICQGHLINPRDGIYSQTNEEVASSSVQACTKAATGQSDYLRSRSAVLERNHSVNLANLYQDLIGRFRSLSLGRQAERGNESETTLEEAVELLQKARVELSSINKPRFFCEFSLLEIKEATQNFNQSLKIGEGGYGNIYKGVLRHTQVAIKIPKPGSEQGPTEFQQEVDVLSRIRHPNLVTLIGTCPEACALIYEYLPNGSLEDRLRCKDNSPPLSWQTRICVAAELCCVLIFLHSHRFFHGDLKPSNILFDVNFRSKLCDFGISRSLSHEENSSNETTLFCRTSHPKGTIGYMDPAFFPSGEFTRKSDVYAFGIILLQLLTGRPPWEIAKEVKRALAAGNLKTILDPLAGDWPFANAEQLARLAMRCCEMDRKSRPDLASDVWSVLEPMRASSGGTSLLQLVTKEH